MFELMRQHPFALVFSIIGHVALGGLLFVALEQQYGEDLTEPGNDIEIVQAVLVNSPDVTDEIARLREQVAEQEVVEPEVLEPEVNEPEPIDNSQEQERSVSYTHLTLPTILLV